MNDRQTKFNFGRTAQGRFHRQALVLAMVVLSVGAAACASRELPPQPTPPAAVASASPSPVERLSAAISPAPTRAEMTPTQIRIPSYILHDSLAWDAAGSRL